eukprot:gnl/Spiro4/8107_TR4272_c0_g1_i1.p1 gnl/Spiro4/8107_TR4272_c0_g1~~gnl/Spiro4/8107_TR4272_c0_g1_i1.p1  ORF type:complete len:646 (+),score=115.22 gnl/Spiro4/8107_TR4272_c0_g1_i1:70-2007(+)
MNVQFLGNQSAPCTLIEFCDTRILIDCGLDVGSLLRFLPCDPALPINAKVGDQPFAQCGLHTFLNGAFMFEVPDWTLCDLQNVDAILITSYFHLMGLPFLSEFTNYRGPIYATEPSVAVGRQLMEELVEFVEQDLRAPVNLAGNNKLLSPKGGAVQELLKNSHSWRPMYSKHDIRSCLSRVTTVSWHQHIAVGSTRVMATSSGFCLGSSNWIIKSLQDQIAYVGAAATAVARHPQPLDVAALRSSTVLVLSDLAPPSHTSPDATLNELCHVIGNTLHQRGNVLLPCFPTGLLFDLLDCLEVYLQQIGLGKTVPIYVVSPQAENSLEYSNIVSEWLCTAKQDRVFLPDAPFSHGELVRSGVLFRCAGVDSVLSASLREPAIVFTGHPSARCGSVVQFIQRWGGSASNSIIFTEPGFDPARVLAPFQPLSCRVASCILNAKLSVLDANLLLRDVSPQHVIAPAAFVASSSTPPPTLQSQRLLLQHRALTPWQQLTTVTLPIVAHTSRVLIPAEMASTVNDLTQVGDARSARVTAVIAGTLSMSGGAPTEHAIGWMTQASVVDAAKLALTRRTLLWGTVSPSQLVAALSDSGIFDCKVVQENQLEWAVFLPSIHACVRLSPHQTHISTHDPATRSLLSGILLSLLSQL